MNKTYFHNLTFYNRKILRLIIHLLAWVIIIGISFVNAPDNYIRVARPLLEAALLFYINYFILIEKCIFKKKQYGLFILINILMIVLFRFDMPLWELLSGNDFKIHKEKIPDNKHLSRPFDVIKSLLGLIMPSLLALVVKISERSRTFELEKKETENMHLKSELKNLKYQLHPHFFFNALNNIYALVDESPTKTQQAIHNLSKLMQYLLHDAESEKVDLFTELNFLKKYIHLMELRQTEDVTVDYTFPEIAQNQYHIAPLLLIPIVENAYKHGISAIRESKIIFDLSIADNKLFFISRNTNNPKSESDISGSGIGLENLKKRLELIYPQKHQLHIEVKDNIFNLSLIIEL